MELLSLTYISQASTTLDDGDVERILYAAQVNNGLDGITGFLMFNGTSFLQVLEGSQQAVEDVMTRITADPRHRDVTVVDRHPAAERAFPDWTMGFLRLSGDIGNAAAIERALKRETPPAVRDQLVAMAGSLAERT